MTFLFDYSPFSLDGVCPSSVKTSGFATYTLAVPKIFRGIRLEYFDRCAKSCSLHRPQDALRKLCSWGRLTIEPPLPKGGRATKWRGDSLKTVRPVLVGQGYNPSPDFVGSSLYTREPAPTGRLFGEIRIFRYAQNDIGLSLRAYRRYAWQSVSPFIGTVKTVPYSNAIGLQLLNRRGGYIHPVLTGQSQHLISHLR